MGCKGSYTFGGKGFKGYNGGWKKKFSKDFTKSKSWEKKAWKFKACDKRDDDDFDFGGKFGGFKKWNWKKEGWAKNVKKWGCEDDKKEIKIAVCFDRDDDGGKGWGKGQYKKWWKKKAVCERPEQPEEPETPELPEVPVDTNNAPVITSPSNDEPLSITPGMTGIVAAVQATDADNDNLEFIIDPSSEDANIFEIDAATGLLSLLGEAMPNGSHDGNSSYEITVEVSDGQASDTIDLIFDYYTGA